MIFFVTIITMRFFILFLEMQKCDDLKDFSFGEESCIFSGIFMIISPGKSAAAKGNNDKNE